MVQDVSTIFAAEITDKQQLDYLNISKNLILKNINSVRSNYQFNENQDNTEPNILPPMKESYCHAFFRILGLPVISADKTKFYNPGFYGNEIGQIEIDRRNAIDRTQDQSLFTLETAREFIAYGNGLNFEANSTKQQYRFDLLKQSMSVNLIDENKGPFDYDQQIDNVDNRYTYKPVQKILRPFKCVPNLTNKVIPATNMICAPFVNEANSKLRNSVLTKPYLEFVARIRLSKDITSNTTENTLSQALSKKIEDLNIGSVLSSFSNSVKDLSVLELYVIEQLFITLIDVCNNINKGQKAAQELVAKMEYKLGENIKFTNEGVITDTLEVWIQERQEKIAAKELLLSQIPGFKIEGIGDLNNKIPCILTNSFIELVQPDLENLKKELDALNKEKKKRVSAFNSINSELFYLVGEVNGLGLIDILAMMLSFWLISSEELVSMFDDESFNRLLKEPSLYSDVVEKRINNKSPTLGISEVMESYDKNITLILKLADSIVESEKAI